MFLTVEQYLAEFGEEETLQVAGTGPRDYRELDRPKIEASIGWAEAIILGFVRERYPVVVRVTTPLLSGWCADIARWRLRGRGGQQTAMNDIVQKRYEEAMKALKAVADGSLALDLPPDSGAETTAAGGLAVLGDMPPARAPAALEGWR